MYRKYFKRLMDIVLSIFAIVLLSPIIGVVALLVRAKLGAPIIFRQDRPGLNEKIFTMYKFRTMTDKKDEQGHLLPDEVRLTHFGQFLRSTSLDELPELLNIVRGDMSIVGPRPLLIKYMKLYSQEQRRRHLVRPGLTGNNAMYGRNNVPWEERFRNDVYYVDHYSFWYDVKIIWVTFFKVIKREGISCNGHATMTEYSGEKQMNG